eukprot:scaffold9345_cov120-Cylindrotheca_fusiformis.AAC.22
MELPAGWVVRSSDVDGFTHYCPLTSLTIADAAEIGQSLVDAAATAGFFFFGFLIRLVNEVTPNSFLAKCLMASPAPSEVKLKAIDLWFRSQLGSIFDRASSCLCDLLYWSFAQLLSSPALVASIKRRVEVGFNWSIALHDYKSACSMVVDENGILFESKVLCQGRSGLIVSAYEC